MKNKRIKLHEDITPTSSIDNRTTIEELYDELGTELFDDANIPVLKEYGLLNSEGYPVSTYEDYNGEIQHGIYTCEDIYTNFDGAIDQPYIQELFLDEIHRNLSDDGLCIVYEEEDLPSFREMGEKFIAGCFNGDVYEFFWDNYDIGFNDCSYYIDNIPEAALDILEEKGFPRDIYNQMYKGEADEDSPLAKYYNDLEFAMSRAVENAYAIGSSNECQRDFDNAWKESIPEGCTWEYDKGDEVSRVIHFTDEFLREHITGIWENFDSYATAGECVRVYIIRTINDNLNDNFREPYYGWSEFDDDAFAESIVDEIEQIDFEVPEDSQPEEDLLKFNGESGEYEEELEEDITPISLPATAPKKLYYKYKEYTPELSSKAYQLDLMRVTMLLDWAKEYNKELYNAVNTKVEDDVNEVGEYLSGIIISSIKPSYAMTYFPDGYTIWSMNFIDYNVEFLGSIPYSVGKQLLKGVPISEGIEVVPVPMDEELYKGIPLDVPEDILTKEDYEYNK